jgi:hypothetical protein
MTELLHLEGVIIANYHVIADIGIVLYLKNRSRETSVFIVKTRLENFIKTMN